MPIPSWDMMPEQMVEIFKNFRNPEVGYDMIVNQNFFVEQMLPMAIAREISEEEMNRYRAPYLEPSSRKPLYVWPNEIPIEGEPADVAEIVGAYSQWLQQTELPKLMFYGNPGAIITAPVVEMAKQTLKNLSTVDIGEGVHYLQEDNPHLIGSEIAEWYKKL